MTWKSDRVKSRLYAGCLSTFRHMEFNCHWILWTTRGRTSSCHGTRSSVSLPTVFRTECRAIGCVQISCTQSWPVAERSSRLWPWNAHIHVGRRFARGYGTVAFMQETKELSVERIHRLVHEADSCLNTYCDCFKISQFLDSWAFFNGIETSCQVINGRKRVCCVWL